METPQAKAEFARLDFNGTTSRIFTYLGRVYVRNSNDFNEWNYHLATNSNEWMMSYIQKHHLTDIKDQDKHLYIGQQTLIRTDAVLRKLMGIRGISNEEYANAVNRSDKAMEWVRALRRGVDSIEWWFANGCPLEEKDLNQVIKWSEQKGFSNEEVASRSVANTILRCRRKKSEMETSSETR